MGVVLWIIISVLTQHTALLVRAFSCLTWKFHRNELQIIYKTKNFSSPLHFFDNDGVEKGFCDFENVCDDQNIFVDVPKGSVVLHLKVVERSKISGNWSCKQGSHLHSTYVTESGDFDSSMQLLMKGELIRQQDKPFVNVECSSCREPYRNKVYYVLNDMYGDVIYKTNLNSCSSNNGICDGFLCSCSTWPIFRKTYPKDDNNEMIFTCSMRFHQGSKYIDKTSILSFDGNNSFTFLELTHQKGSRTSITTIKTLETPEKHQRVKEKICLCGLLFQCQSVQSVQYYLQFALLPTYYVERVKERNQIIMMISKYISCGILTPTDAF